MPYFTPPTHEQPMRTNVRPLNYYRLTHAQSIVRINGTFTPVWVPSFDLLTDLEPGVDYFRGGFVYEVSDEVAADLTAQGYEVLERPPGPVPIDPPGYGHGRYGNGRYGH